MSDGPTTFNGLLQTPDANLGDRLISASYSNLRAAESAREMLINAGIPGDRITLAEDAGAAPEVQAATAPPDQSIVGRIREAVLPEDSATATRAAARNGEALLQVRPLREEVELIVATIETSMPTRFDPDLERWRNKG